MDKSYKILHVKQQLAALWNCKPSDFDNDENVFIPSTDTYFEIVTFGNNAVIRGNEKMLDWCKGMFQHAHARDIMDADHLYSINTKLRSMGKKLGGEHIRYLLINPQKQIRMPNGFTYRWYDMNTIKELYGYKAFNNALNFKTDVIAIAAFKEDQLVAMAAADNYMEPMWQIGIDTTLEYRKQGIGTYLVHLLALEIQNKGKIPFYTTWGANMGSTKIALTTGFYPVWMGYPSEDL
jgi:hypothetical protein